MKKYYRLRFSPAVATDVKEAGRNPKRVQREVRKQVKNTGIGTKSQWTLKLQQEQLKTECKIVSREQRETEKQRQMLYITVESGALSDEQKELLIKRLTEVSSEIMKEISV